MFTVRWKPNLIKQSQLQCGRSYTIERKGQRNMNTVVNRMIQTVHSVLLFVCVSSYLADCTVLISVT